MYANASTRAVAAADFLLPVAEPQTVVSQWQVTCAHRSFHDIGATAQARLDHLHLEWNNKAAGIVSYGAAGGARAAEQLRLICGALQIADVAGQVTLSLFTEFDDRAVLMPSEFSVNSLGAMLDQVVAWTSLLATLRARPASVT